MKRSTKIVFPILILAGGFVAMMALLNLRSDPSERSAKPRAKSVEAEIITLSTIPAEITAYGRMTSAQPVELFSEVSGTLTEGDVPYQPGQLFVRGDLLLRIDDRQARLALNSRKSELLTALATLLPEIKIDFPEEYQIWQDYFNGCEFGTKVTPLPETANEKIKLFLSRFNVYQLYFAVRDLEIRLEKHYFHAPFDGAIVTANLRVGSTARNGTLLGEIINLERFEVEVPVPAEDTRWIDHDLPVTFTSSEMAGRWTGKIKRIGSTIDTRTQSVSVFISVADGQQAPRLNGVFLEARIPGLNIERAVAIPRKALYEERFVYLIVDGKLEYREVTVTRRETNTVIITAGVSDGDTLVTEVLQGVAPGMLATARLNPAEGRSR